MRRGPFFITVILASAMAASCESSPAEERGGGYAILGRPLTAMEPEELIQEFPLRTWGIRLLKTVVAAVTLYFTYRFVTHAGFNWSRLAHRVASANPLYIALGTGLLLLRYALCHWPLRRPATLAVA